MTKLIRDKSDFELKKLSGNERKLCSTCIVVAAIDVSLL